MATAATGIILRPIRPALAVRRLAIAGIAIVAILSVGACAGQTTGQKGATAGAALGSGIAIVSGAGLATTIGAGLIGGAAGYLGGEAVDSRKKK